VGIRLHNGRVTANNPRKLPSQLVMAWSTLCAVKQAGGSASNAEIMQAVSAELKLTDEQRALLCGYGSRTLLDHRLAWARTFLKNMGALANDAPCQWSITQIGQETTPEDIQQVAKRQLDKLAEYEREKQASRALGDEPVGISPNTAVRSREPRRTWAGSSSSPAPEERPRARQGAVGHAVYPATHPSRACDSHGQRATDAGATARHPTPSRGVRRRAVDWPEGHASG
jgi:hypothetical protein